MWEELKGVLAYTLLVASVVANYFMLLRKIDRKVDRERFEKNNEDARKGLAEGIDTIEELYKDVDARLTDHDWRIKILEKAKD